MINLVLKISITRPKYLQNQAIYSDFLANLDSNDSSYKNRGPFLVCLVAIVSFFGVIADRLTLPRLPSARKAVYRAAWM